MGNPEVEKERRAQVMALCRANEDGASPCRSKGNLNQAFSQGIEGEVTKKSQHLKNCFHLHVRDRADTFAINCKSTCMYYLGALSGCFTVSGSACTTLVWRDVQERWYRGCALRGGKRVCPTETDILGMPTGEMQECDQVGEDN